MSCVSFSAKFGPNKQKKTFYNSEKIKERAIMTDITGNKDILQNRKPVDRYIILPELLTQVASYHKVFSFP